jgi:hypothetical protein
MAREIIELFKKVLERRADHILGCPELTAPISAVSINSTYYFHPSVYLFFLGWVYGLLSFWAVDFFTNDLPEKAERETDHAAMVAKSEKEMH